MATVVLDAARATLAAHGDPVAAVGITNQRGSAVVWDRATGVPVGPAQGWQDLRTIVSCLTHRAAGFRFAPNTAATKVESILDTFDPDRTRDLCVGTVDSWITWTLTEGAHHVTDASNAAVTSFLAADGSGWHQGALDALRIPARMLPTLVDTSGIVGPATALPGAPPIAALVGDQQASLVGQGCVRAGPAKITFGTGGMLDLVVGPQRPTFETRARAARSRSSRCASAASTRGDSRRSCSRPAPTWSGCATTSASSRRRRRATTSRRSARTPAASPTCPRSWASARRAGTTARAARCSA